MSRIHSVSVPYAVLATLSLASLYSCAPKTENAVVKREESPVSTAKPTTPPKPTTVVPPVEGGIGKYQFVRPETVKGIYLTAWSAGSTRKMEKMVNLVDKTELNAVVIDVRDSGQMYWKTGIKLADESKATMVAVAKPEKLMTRLRKHNIWPIARIAIFRDNYVTKTHPELAVQHLNGKVWKDRAGNAWLDPFNKKNWDYIGQIVDFALDAGFPEIQFDYVRFPSEGKMASMKFGGRATYPDPKATPADVIAEFCAEMRKRVKARGAEFTADIFGIISSSSTKDQGIGQSLEKIAKPFDVICPMVYPSHFANGEYGVANPNKQPYLIVRKSLTDYKRRVPESKVRPWLQDFSLFGVHYGADEVKAQVKAARELGYNEFLLWNAGNHYTEAALESEEAPKLTEVPSEKSATVPKP